MAGGAGVLVLAVRVFMLVGENGVRAADVAGVEPEPARSGQPDQRHGADLRSGRGDQATPARRSPDYGYPPGALIGRRLPDFVHPEDIGCRARRRSPSRSACTPPTRPRRGRQRCRRCDAGRRRQPPADSGPVPCRVRAADGTWRHVESTVLLYQVPGEPARMLLTVRDVSDQVALRQQVTHLTFHDGLTGLPNRAYVEERDQGRAARRRGGPAWPASSSSTLTASPRSTTRSATAQATWCSPRRPGGCAPSCRPRTRSPAGAATSSPC